MKLNRNTKKARGFIWSYKRSEVRALCECYNSYSYAKAAAEKICREKMLDMDGYGFKILASNCMTFTCGWLYEDKETGVVMLDVETAYNSYQMEY